MFICKHGLYIDNEAGCAHHHEKMGSGQPTETLMVGGVFLLFIILVAAAGTAYDHFTLGTPWW